MLIGSLLSVIGALTLFFSWVFTNLTRTRRAARALYAAGALMVLVGTALDRLGGPDVAAAKGEATAGTR